MSGGSGRGGRGIDPKVREAALEAARRHGIPVGDWLSDGLVGAAPAMDPTAGAEEPAEAMAPMHSRRIAEALERLANRIESVEQRNTLAVVSLDRTVLGLATRVDDTEIGAREEALRMLAALGDVKGSQDALSIRLQRAEQSLTEAQNPAALKALDKQLGKLAQQVHEIDGRTGADAAALRQTIDSAEAKIAAAQADAETRARELAARFTEVTSGVASAEAKAQAAVARAGDVEGKIAVIADDAKRDVAAARAAVDQTATSMKSHLASMESRLAEMNNRADAALNQLGAEVKGLSARFGDVERSVAAANTVQTARIDDLQAVLARDTEALKSEMASRLSAAAADAADQLAQTRNDLSAEIANAIDGVRSDDVEATLADVNRRIAAAERRQAQTIEAVSVEIKRITEAVDKRIRGFEAQPLAAVAAPGGGLAPDALDAVMSQLAGQVSAGEGRAREELIKLAQRFDKRLEASDSQSAGAIEQIGQQISGLADTLNARQDKFAGDLADQVRQVDQRAQDRLADMMNAVGARLAEVAERNDASIAPIQAAVSEISGRLQSLEERSFAAPARPLDQPLATLEPPPAPVPPAAAIAPEPDLELEPLIPAPAAREPEQDAPADIEDALLDLTAADDPSSENFWDLDPDEPAAAAAEPEPARKAAKPDYIESARRAAKSATAPALAAAPKAAKPKAEKPAKVKPEPSLDDGDKPKGPFGLRGSSAGLWVAIGALGVAAAAGVALVNLPRDAKPAAAVTQSKSPAGAPAQAKPAAAPQQETLDQAAARGDAAAQYELALSQLVAGDATKGLATLRQSADQGLAVAQYRLAKMYERGEGVEKDLRQSWQWTESAAKGGNRKAMYDLGVFYARGEGAPFNEAEAFKWFRQAAEHGVLDGQFNLGVLYQQGRGVKANPSEALFWFLVAANGGDADARARAASLEARVPAKDQQALAARATAFQPKPFDQRANGVFPDRTWPAPAGIDTTTP